MEQNTSYITAFQIQFYNFYKKRSRDQIKKKNGKVFSNALDQVCEKSAVV